MVHRRFHHLHDVVRIRMGGARHKGRPRRQRLFHRIDRVIHRAPHVGLALETQRRGGRGLLLGQPIHPIVHRHARQLDVLARGVGEMVSADGKEVAVPAEHKHMQVRPRQGHATGEGQRAAMNIVRAVTLHEVRKPARAADAGNGGDLFLPEAAFLDQLEVQREHRKITATGAPGRMVRRQLLLGERLPLRGGGHSPGGIG